MCMIPCRFLRFSITGEIQCWRVNKMQAVLLKLNQAQFYIYRILPITVLSGVHKVLPHICWA